MEIGVRVDLRVLDSKSIRSEWPSTPNTTASNDFQQRRRPISGEQLLNELPYEQACSR